MDEYIYYAGHALSGRVSTTPVKFLELRRNCRVRSMRRVSTASIYMGERKRSVRLNVRRGRQVVLLGEHGGQADDQPGLENWPAYALMERSPTCPLR